MNSMTDRSTAVMIYIIVLLFSTYQYKVLMHAVVKKIDKYELMGTSSSNMSLAMKQVVLLFLIVTLSSVLGQQDCKIKIDPDDKYASTYFNYFRWTRPKHSLGTNVDSIKHGAFIKFSCESGFVRDELVGNSYTFQCTNGTLNRTLLYEDTLCRATFHKLTETYQVSPIQLASKVFKCDEKGWQLIQVKARKPDGSSRHLYTVCFDTTVLRTKFVHQPRQKEVPGRNNVSRNDVWGFDRFGKDTREKLKLSEGYVSKIQQDRITKAFPERYNPQRKYPYTFNRGHLAPYADFIDQEDKRASCEYINVAPQWKEFNGNSWSLIERETRDMVRERPYDWEIYTGTYSSIPTSKGPLYVSPLFDRDGKYIKSFVPVPKLYWKVVHNLADRTKSKVFVGINNPELRSPAEFTDKYVICKPIPDKNGKKFQGSEYKGFTYQCQLDEFLQKLKTDEKIVK